MLSLLGDAKDAHAQLVVDSAVDAIETGTPHTVQIRSGSDAFLLEAAVVVSAAGLWAPAAARRIKGLGQQHIPTPYFAKGNYARLVRKSPFERLIYPVPEPGRLGVHLTLDLNGRARFGPNVHWLEDKDPATIDMTVAPAICEPFASRIRQYWPGIRREDLARDCAGIRPKISRRGTSPADFRIDGAETHHITGLVNLFGIESPALSIAEAIVAGL